MTLNIFISIQTVLIVILIFKVNSLKGYIEQVELDLSFYKDLLHDRYRSNLGRIERSYSDLNSKIVELKHKLKEN